MTKTRIAKKAVHMAMAGVAELIKIYGNVLLWHGDSGD